MFEKQFRDQFLIVYNIAPDTELWEIIVDCLRLILRSNVYRYNMYKVNILRKQKYSVTKVIVNVPVNMKVLSGLVQRIHYNLSQLHS